MYIKSIEPYVAEQNIFLYIVHISLVVELLVTNLLLSLETIQALLSWQQPILLNATPSPCVYIHYTNLSAFYSGTAQIVLRLWYWMLSSNRTKKNYQKQKERKRISERHTLGFLWFGNSFRTIRATRSRVTRSNTNPRSGIRTAVSPTQGPNGLLTQVVAAMDSCFCLIRPHRHTHVAKLTGRNRTKSLM